MKTERRLLRKQFESEALDVVSFVTIRFDLAVTLAITTHEYATDQSADPE